MTLIIVHSHFRPGGVRRVIELATPHLVAHWPERVRAVVRATGEAPERDWLRAFRARLGRTPVKVMLEPAFGYTSELRLERKRLEASVIDGVLRVLRVALRGEGLIWAHNLGLGRNLYLARELTRYCDASGTTLIAHHHDWWFENRWQHFAAMGDPGFRRLPAVASAVLAAAGGICHVAINQADAKVLNKYFPDHAGWLPNPVERTAPPARKCVEAARAWLHRQLGEEAPVWLLPCRLLRRKNIAEALLLTRWLRPEAWLVTTGGVSSADEQAYADTLAAAAQTRGWRLRLGVLNGDESAKPSVADLLAASEAVVLTSLQEGFGLAYLEAAAARRPLVARRLPNIAPDLAEFGFKFPQSYHEIQVEPALFDWPSERERQLQLFAEWKRLMPDTASDLVGKPALLAAGNKPVPVPFSRLTLTAQIEVLSQPVELSWQHCVALNPFLQGWRERARAGELKTSPWPPKANRWVGGPAYARRFLELLPHWMAEHPSANAGKAAQAEFLRQKLAAENLYPLLWNPLT